MKWNWWQTGYDIVLIRAAGDRLVAASLNDGVLVGPELTAGRPISDCRCGRRARIAVDELPGATEVVPDTFPGLQMALQHGAVTAR